MEGPDPWGNWEEEEQQLRIIRDILNESKDIPTDESNPDSAKSKNITHADIHAEIRDSRRQREARLEKDLDQGECNKKPTSSKSTKSSEPTPRTALSDNTETPRGISKAEQFFRILEEGKELFEGKGKPSTESTDSDEETVSQGEKPGEFISCFLNWNPY